MYTKRIIDLTVRLIRAGRLAYTKRWSFLVLSSCMFFLSVAVLGRFDLLPSAAPVEADTPVVTLLSEKAPATSTLAIAAVVEQPTKIEIPAISLSATISNPTSTVIATLDQELLKGAVRYPTSALSNS